MFEAVFDFPGFQTVPREGTFIIVGGGLEWERGGSYINFTSFRGGSHLHLKAYLGAGNPSF